MLYSRWLDSASKLFTFSVPPRPASLPNAKAEQVAANEEWEDEGGSTKGKN